MRVLLLGAGAREHALAWKLSQSPLLEKLWCASGNPGTASLGENLALQAEDPKAVTSAAKDLRADLVVIGPEAPLVAGVADELRAKGIAVFGPSRAAAALEGSKAFAKEVMEAAGIPTARYRVFDRPADAEAYARTVGPVVVKADGLAAGKGVIVAESGEEAVEAIREVSRLKEASRRLVLEERLSGEEVSVIALCDGERYVLLPPARDHKRVGDGDQGPNTGGMGAYAPSGALSASALEEIGRGVMAPALLEMKRRGASFSGALYAGLMLTPKGPRVLEFNCRFGDPETQPLMLLIDEDLLPRLDACARGELGGGPLKVSPQVAVGVVLAAQGYPASPRAGDSIDGLEDVKDAVVFHAGTKSSNQGLVTAGGRVLTVCARASTIEEARRIAYAAVERIRFKGMHYRRDIGAAPRR